MGKGDGQREIKVMNRPISAELGRDQDFVCHRLHLCLFQMMAQQVLVPVVPCSTNN